MRAFSTQLEPAGIEVRFMASRAALRPSGPVPDAAAFAACTLLFEQVDLTGLKIPEALPPSCRVVRFPALDTNLLWPFHTLNIFSSNEDADEGHYPGNRVLQRAVERDWSLERILDYYASSYDEYRIDLTTWSRLDRRRLHAIDGLADVAGADLTQDVVSERKFHYRGHPYSELLRVLGERLIVAAGDALPAGISASRFDFSDYDTRQSVKVIPVHPQVARELGLAWYDPAETYLRRDGSRPDHDEYVRGFVEDMQRNRSRASAGDTRRLWQPSLDGARVVGPAIGMHSDGFAEPMASFDVIAERAFETLIVDAYLPPQHAGSATVACSVGDARAEATVEPGAAFSLAVPSEIAAGERASVELTCSERLNMFESARGEDGRDLGFLVLGVRLAP